MIHRPQAGEVTPARASPRSPRVHTTRGRSSGRSATRLQPWEFFLMNACLHNLNPEAVRAMATACIAQTGLRQDEAETTFEESVAAARRCIPGPESWPEWGDALHAIDLRQSTEKMMLWWLTRCVLNCGDEDKAQQLLPTWIESAAVAAASTVGLYGPEHRWRARKLLLSPPMKTAALSVAQRYGLSVKHALELFGMAQSTAYRLLGKKSK
jgi:hypothetical protein